MSRKKIHYNPPQLRSMLIGAPNEVLVAGRGTGKTEGVGAVKTSNCYFKTMPRGTGVFLSATFNQSLTRTLPGLVAGWEKIGYKLGYHYLVGEKPKDKFIKRWKWEGPFRPPFEYKYFVAWFNSAGAHIVSQDVKGSANGITIDWIYGDEAKYLNVEKYQTELSPANRGIVPDFAGNPYHHGVTFTTDMPVGSSGRWILDYFDKMDVARINRIYEIQVAKWKLQQYYKHAHTTQLKSELLKQFQVIEDELTDLRKDLLFYHEASTLENIHALGIEYIKQQLRESTQFQFDTQILNIRPLKIEDGFYPDFDEEIHGYYANNNEYLHKIDFDLSVIKSINCLRDTDLNLYDELHIALDYNRRIHPLVVGQLHGNDLRIVKGLHSLYPKKLKDVLKDFVNYYKPHKTKVVQYWYDHTATGEQHEDTIKDEVVDYLTDAGWIVIPNYIGQAPGHEDKYRMFGHLLQDDGEYPFTLSINRENCDKLILSIYQAPAEQKKDGFGKDKSSERDPAFPADESTHYSDAFDTLVHGILKSGIYSPATSLSDETIITN